jgi:hypothetical protein
MLALASAPNLPHRNGCYNFDSGERDPAERLWPERLRPTFRVHPQVV